MDINSTSTACNSDHQINSNKKIKLTPFIVVPPTSSTIVKLEDNLIKGSTSGNHLSSSNVNATNITVKCASIGNNSSLINSSSSNTNNNNFINNNINGLITSNNNSSTTNNFMNATNSMNSTSVINTTYNNKIIEKSAPTNYLMINGLSANMVNQFVDSQTRNQLNSLCINKLSTSSNNSSNGNTSINLNQTNVSNSVLNNVTSSNTSLNNSTNTLNSQIDNTLNNTLSSTNNKVSVQYLSVSYNNNGNISITNTTPTTASLGSLNTNVNSITINSSDLQQQILNSLKRSDLNLNLVKPSLNSNTSTNDINNTQHVRQINCSTVTSLPGTITLSNSTLNGPSNSNCDQPTTTSTCENTNTINLEDCQLTLHCTSSNSSLPLTISSTNSLTNTNNSSNQKLDNTLLVINNNVDANMNNNSNTGSSNNNNNNCSENIISNNNLTNNLNNDAPLNDYDIKSLNSNHNLLTVNNSNLTNRFLISPTDFLTLTEDHNNNVNNNSNNYVRNPAVKRDVSLSSGCLSSSVELLRKSNSTTNYLGSLNNNFIGYDRYCESPFSIDSHREMHLLDDDDDLKDVNKEFINSEDLFFGTSLSDATHLDQNQLDQLVFILDHQQQPETTDINNLDQINQQNNCFVILDINQQQQQQTQSQQNQITNKSKIENPFNQTSNSISSNNNSVLLNCLTNVNPKKDFQTIDNITSKNDCYNEVNFNDLLINNSNSSNTKIIDGIKYIIQNNDTIKAEKTTSSSLLNDSPLTTLLNNDSCNQKTKENCNNLLKINNLPAYLANSTNNENGQLVVNVGTSDMNKLNSLNNKQSNNSTLLESSSSALNTSAILIQHAGRINNNRVSNNNDNMNNNNFNNCNFNSNNINTITIHHNNSSNNSCLNNKNSTSSIQTNTNNIKCAVKNEIKLSEAVVQTDLTGLKEKSENLTINSADLDLANLLGKTTTTVNVSVAAEEAVSSTTNNIKSVKSVCSPDSSTILIQNNNNLTNNNANLNNNCINSSANNLPMNSMTILTNGDANTVSTNSINQSANKTNSTTPATLVATTNSSNNNSTYTLLPTGLLQLAANIAAVFPTSSVQKHQVALQLLREDGTSIIVPITTPGRNCNTNSSSSNLSTNTNSQLSAINQDGNVIVTGTNNSNSTSVQQTTALPQATQLITISADSLNNLMQGGLNGNGNVVATITTGQSSNPTVITTTLGPPTAASTTTSTTSSITASDQDRPFKCDLCNSTFTRLGNFTRHKKIHSLPSKDQRFKCDICGKSFIQRCDLARHLHIHRGTEPHRCSQCGKGYIRHSDLVTHQRFHNKEKPFACPHCSKGFCQRGDLNRHLRSIHLQLKPILCTQCHKKFAKEETLLRHINANHR